MPKSRSAPVLGRSNVEMRNDFRIHDVRLPSQGRFLPAFHLGNAPTDTDGHGFFTEMNKGNERGFLPLIMLITQIGNAGRERAQEGTKSEGDFSATRRQQGAMAGQGIPRKGNGKYYSSPFR